MLFWNTPLRGATTSLFAATSPEVCQHMNQSVLQLNICAQVVHMPSLYKGAYLVPYGRIAAANPKALDENLASGLWASTERIVGEILETGSTTL